MRYEELCMYNMSGVLFVASVTSFGQKSDFSVCLDLVKIAKIAEISRSGHFWPLLATCHRDDMCEI